MDLNMELRNTYALGVVAADDNTIAVSRATSDEGGAGGGGSEVLV